MMAGVSEQRRRIMRAVRSKQTSPELQVRRVLRELGFSGYRLHRRDLPGKPDIAFVGRRKAIFVNGCFWHGHNCKRGARIPKSNQHYWKTKISGNMKRDAENILALQSMGWETLTIWECELGDISELKRRLDEFISQF